MNYIPHVSIYHNVPLCASYEINELRDETALPKLNCVRYLLYMSIKNEHNSYLCRSITHVYWRIVFTDFLPQQTQIR